MSVRNRKQPIPNTFNAVDFLIWERRNFNSVLKLVGLASDGTALQMTVINYFSKWWDILNTILIREHVLYILEVVFVHCSLQTTKLNGPFLCYPVYRTLSFCIV